DHWAHLVIHGVLHLLGFDHIEDQQAACMEAKEIAVLQKLSINNPYIEAVNS
ncbi:MAG: rRNA maturation RNase YbeY, partial [Methylococcales bacterium]|nr:rRNA maturation RNase YbeY [Methylococcales bacterium]